MSGKITSLTKRRAMMKPDPLRWGFDSWTGSMGRWHGYYDRLIPDLSHPAPDGPMLGTCPLCRRPGAFALDPLCNLWECRGCTRAGNQWALEAFLNPCDDWGECADRADRIVWGAWKEGSE